MKHLYFDIVEVFSCILILFLLLFPLFKRLRKYMLNKTPEYSFPHMIIYPFNRLDSSDFKVIFVTMLYYLLYAFLISIFSVIISVFWLPILISLLITIIIYIINKKTK